MPSPALAALGIALGDVDNFVVHHPKTADPSPGPPSTDEGPLLRACVVLLYASWEVYVEDGVIWAIEEVTQRSEPGRLPAALRVFVAETAKDNPWRLAGALWQTTTVDEVTKLARGDDQAGTFGVNTAGPGQIAALHNKIFGEQLLNKCRWAHKPTKTIKRPGRVHKDPRLHCPHWPRARTASPEGRALLAELHPPPRMPARYPTLRIGSPSTYRPQIRSDGQRRVDRKTGCCDRDLAEYLPVDLDGSGQPSVRRASLDELGLSLDPSAAKLPTQSPAHRRNDARRQARHDRSDAAPSGHGLPGSGGI